MKEPPDKPDFIVDESGNVEDIRDKRSSYYTKVSPRKRKQSRKKFSNLTNWSNYSKGVGHFIQQISEISGCCSSFSCSGAIGGGSDS